MTNIFSDPMGLYHNHGKESLWKKIVKKGKKNTQFLSHSFFLPRCSLNFTNSFSFYRNVFWMLYIDWVKCTT